MNSTTGTFNASVSVYPSNDTSGATNGSMMVGSGGVGSMSISSVTNEAGTRRGVGSLQVVVGTILALLVVGAGCLL